MASRKKLWAAAALIASLLPVGCGSLHTPRAPALNTTWLDLLAGWRLRVIAPVLKDASEPYDLSVTPSGPLALTVTATPNLLGFETQYFSVEGKQTAVRFRFAQATKTINGQTTSTSAPSKVYLPVSAPKRHIRLVFLARSTEVPHDMAVLSARNDKDLQRRTSEVMRNPNSCGTAESACSWIPIGIAVRAERKDQASNSWVPVQ